MINIAKLLKDAPKGMKLYSPLLGEVEFAEVMDTGYMPIRVMKRGYGLRFDKYGRYMGNEYPDAECVLFPSKEVRTWEGWKLPSKPAFKVNEWIILDRTYTIPIQIVEINQKEGLYTCKSIDGLCGNYSITQTDKDYHLWTIQDAKDGDVLVYQDEIFLFNLVDNNSVLYHCCFDGELVVHSFYAFSNEDLLHVHPATKEQRDLLFAKMKEAGYEWDAEKGEPKKTKPHYDIANFHAGIPVLVRADNVCRWDYSVFSRITGNEGWPFAVCNGVSFTQCIPYDGNEHLLGTSDMCDEMYINW
jgi:hypothetical protein